MAGSGDGQTAGVILAMSWPFIPHTGHGHVHPVIRLRLRVWHDVWGSMWYGVWDPERGNGVSDPERGITSEVQRGV